MPVSLPPIPRERAAFTFSSTDKVRFGDVDVVGHANSLAIGGFFETSRVDLLREMGVLQTDGALKCSLAKLTFEYLGEIQMFEVVTSADRVAHIGTTSFILQSGLFVTREGQELCVATCEAVCVLIDPATRRPTPILPAARAVLERHAHR
jgi:acyl-CoA thioester hydrolase